MEDIKVGMGVTLHGWSDSTAWTVVRVSKSGNTATLRRDVATLLNPVGSEAPDALRFAAGGYMGHTSGTQRYEYAPGDPATAQMRVINRRKDGRWREAGVRNGNPAEIGVRSEHYDFNF